MLSCGCLGDLGRHAPLVLQCGHVFCKSCLSTAKQQANRYNICSVCGKTDPRHIAQLPRDFALIDAAALDPTAAAIIRGFNIGGALWLDERQLKLPATTACVLQNGISRWHAGKYQGQPVLIRHISLANTPFNAVQALIRDTTIALVALAECPFAAKYRGLTVKDGQLCLVLEEYGASLATLLKEGLLQQEGNGGLPVQRLLHYSCQLLEALSALHSQHIYGIDLSAHNLMFDDNGDKILISDVGIQRLARQYLKYDKELQEQAAYMLPEFLSDTVSPAADMRSWACLVLHISSGTGTETSPSEVFKTRQAPDIPLHLPPFLRALLARCLAIDPHSRPTAEQVLKVLKKQMPSILADLGPDIPAERSTVTLTQQQQQQQRTSHSSGSAAADDLSSESDPVLVITLDKQQHKPDQQQQGLSYDRLGVKDVYTSSDQDLQPAEQLDLQQLSRSLSLQGLGKPKKSFLGRVLSLHPKATRNWVIAASSVGHSGSALQQLLLAGKAELIGGALQLKLMQDKLIKYDHPLGSWYKGLAISSWNGVTVSQRSADDLDCDLDVDPDQHVQGWHLEQSRLPAAVRCSCPDQSAFRSGISSCPRLEALHLAPLQTLDSRSGSKLSLKGRLPGAWSGLTTLISLDLSGNGIGGTLPAAWSSLTALTDLDLSCNKLTWRLPEEWSTLVNLRELCLYQNQLLGGLPASWSTLTDLQTLSLYSNKLTGELPVQWSALVSLQTLVLTDNMLDGVLPAQWGTLQNLKILRLSNNRLSGSLEAEWGALSQLAELSLSCNRLSGGLPHQWSSLGALEWLNLDSNNLTGPISPDWAGLSSLRVLDVRGNRVAGGCLPREWRDKVDHQQLRVYA